MRIAEYVFLLFQLKASVIIGLSIHVVMHFDGTGTVSPKDESLNGLLLSS